MCDGFPLCSNPSYRELDEDGFGSMDAGGIAELVNEVETHHYG
jgi:hypothetical protein